MRKRIENAVLQIASGVAIALIMFFIYGKDANARSTKKDIAETKKEIAKKVDKAEFVKYVDKNEGDHAEIKREIKSEFKADLNDMEKRLNRESDIRDENLREFIKAVVDK